MTQKQATEWLNALIKHHNQLNKLASQYEECSTCNARDDIHIYRGLRKIANLLDLQVTETIRADSQYNVERFFKYKGVKFFEIYNEEKNG